MGKRESAAEKARKAEDFEVKVAALLKVDPQGITGQTGKQAKAKKESKDS